MMQMDLSSFTLNIQEYRRPSNVYGIAVRWFTSIKDIKDQLRKIIFVPASRIHLFHSSSPKILNNQSTLHDLGIDQPGHVLQVAWNVTEFHPSTQYILIPSKGVSRSPATQSLVEEVRLGLQNQQKPIKTDLFDCTGGVYFMRGSAGSRVAVFKPSDEEQGMPNNPKGHAGNGDEGLRPHFKPGAGYLRETAAYIMDYNNFTRVPPTTVIHCEHQCFSYPSYPGGGSTAEMFPKVGSLQQYVSTSDSFDDISPSTISTFELQKIALFDMRILNCDRNAANILVARKNLYHHHHQQQQQSHSGRNIRKDTAGVGSGSAKNFRRDSRSSSMGSYGGLLEYSSLEGGGGLGESLEDFTLYGEDFCENHNAFCNNNSNNSSSNACEHSSAESTAGGDAAAYKYPASMPGAVGFDLYPIDHGYCFPEKLHINEYDWAWFYCRQISEPVDPAIKDYMNSLNLEALISQLRELDIPEDSIFLLRLSHKLLVQGINAGMTLRELAELIARVDEDVPSPLENAIAAAEENTHRAIEARSGRLNSRSPTLQSPTLRSPSGSPRSSFTGSSRSRSSHGGSSKSIPASSSRAAAAGVAAMGGASGGGNAMNGSFTDRHFRQQHQQPLKAGRHYNSVLGNGSYNNGSYYSHGQHYQHHHHDHHQKQKRLLSSSSFSSGSSSGAQSMCSSASGSPSSAVSAEELLGMLKKESQAQCSGGGSRGSMVDIDDIVVASSYVSSYGSGRSYLDTFLSSENGVIGSGVGNGLVNRDSNITPPPYTMMVETTKESGGEPSAAMRTRAMFGQRSTDEYDEDNGDGDGGLDGYVVAEDAGELFTETFSSFAPKHSRRTASQSNLPSMMSAMGLDIFAASTGSASSPESAAARIHGGIASIASQQQQQHQQEQEHQEQQQQEEQQQEKKEEFVCGHSQLSDFPATTAAAAVAAVAVASGRAARPPRLSADCIHPLRHPSSHIYPLSRDASSVEVSPTTVGGVPVAVPVAVPIPSQRVGMMSVTSQSSPVSTNGYSSDKDKDQGMFFFMDDIPSPVIDYPPIPSTSNATAIATPASSSLFITSTAVETRVASSVDGECSFQPIGVKDATTTYPISSRHHQQQHIPQQWGLDLSAKAVSRSPVTLSASTTSIENRSTADDSFGELPHFPLFSTGTALAGKPLRMMRTIDGTSSGSSLLPLGHRTLQNNNNNNNNQQKNNSSKNTDNESKVVVGSFPVQNKHTVQSPQDSKATEASAAASSSSFAVSPSISTAATADKMDKYSRDSSLDSDTSCFFGNVGGGGGSVGESIGLGYTSTESSCCSCSAGCGSPIRLADSHSKDLRSAVSPAIIAAVPATGAGAGTPPTTSIPPATAFEYAPQARKATTETTTASAAAAVVSPTVKESHLSFALRSQHQSPQQQQQQQQSGRAFSPWEDVSDGFSPAGLQDPSNKGCGGEECGVSSSLSEDGGSPHFSSSSSSSPPVALYTANTTTSVTAATAAAMSANSSLRSSRTEVESVSSSTASSYVSPSPCCAFSALSTSSLMMPTSKSIATTATTASSAWTAAREALLAGTPRNEGEDRCKGAAAVVVAHPDRGVLAGSEEETDSEADADPHHHSSFIGLAAATPASGRGIAMDSGPDYSNSSYASNAATINGNDLFTRASPTVATPAAAAGPAFPNDLMPPSGGLTRVVSLVDFPNPPIYDLDKSAPRQFVRLRRERRKLVERSHEYNDQRLVFGLEAVHSMVVKYKLRMAKLSAAVAATGGGAGAGVGASSRTGTA